MTIEGTEQMPDSQEFFRLIAETIQDVFWVSTPGVKRIVYLSPSFEHIWGRTRESLEAEPLSFLESVHPDDREALGVLLRERHAAGQEYRCEYRIVLADGVVRWIEDRGFPIRDPDGSVRLMTGVCKDITGRKQTEESLRQSEAKFKALFEIAPVGIAVVDRERRVIDANPALASILKLSREQLLSGNYQGRTYVRADGSPMTRDEWASSIALKEKRTVQAVETGIVTETGNTIWTLVSAAPLGLPEAAAVTVTQDISEHRRADDELQRTREQLVRLDQALRLGMLGIALAHEVNQPLSGILSNAQAALRLLAEPQPDLGEIRSILADIVADDKRAGAAIMHMRGLVRAKKMPVSPVDINGLIASTVALARKEGVLGETAVKVALTAGQPRVLGMGVQLQQVLLNLLLNARKALGACAVQRREVAVCSRVVPGGRVVVSVEDNGPGFRESDVERVFEPFHAPTDGGLGLGLAISRGIITEHGGRIWAENRTEGGARVSFEVPTIPDPASQGGSVGV